MWHHVNDDPGAGDGTGPGAPPPPAGNGPVPPLPVTPASLAPWRQPAMWLVVAGVALSTLVTLLVGARAGFLTLSGVLVVAGLCRAVLPGPGPAGITVRSRGLDVFFFLAPAVVIVFLTLSVPPWEL